jgi:hypothetical protein
MEDYLGLLFMFNQSVSAENGIPSPWTSEKGEISYELPVSGP